LPDRLLQGIEVLRRCRAGLRFLCDPRAANPFLHNDHYREQNAQNSHANAQVLHDLRLLLHYRYLMVVISNLLDT